MSHWRKRIGDHLDILLAESLRLAHDTGALKKSDLARVTVDTTVQPKNVTFPTDAKLLETAIRQLGKLATKHGVPLRQSYGRVAKKAAMMAGRYAHAKQFKRMNRRIKFLRTRLGRLIRDIRRKTGGDEELREAFAAPLGRASQIRGQKQRQRGWKLSPAACVAPLARRSLQPSPFRASSATFALNSGACCLRFDISDLLLVEDQQTANRSLCQCPNFGG